MKIMAYGHISSWEIDGETVETVSDFIFLGSKITADGDCNPLTLLLGMQTSTDTVSIVFSFTCHEVMGPDAMILVF